MPNRNPSAIPSSASHPLNSASRSPAIARAAATARSAWSTPSTGAPKTAISPSPSWSTRVPPWSSTAPPSVCWRRFSTPMTCSTGWVSAKVVNPRRSRNITVAHRRFALIVGVPSLRASISATIGSGRNRANAFRTCSRSRSCRRLRFSPASIRARRITGSNGLGSRSSAPASMQRTIACESSMPEIMITGMSRRAGSVLRRSSTSIPSRPGISTSSRTTSGRSASIASNAAKPLSTEAVRWPSLARLFSRSARFSGSSSTMRM